MSQQSQNKNPISHARILAADDDPIMREMMLARLGDGVEVVCAENGEIAWEKLSAEKFDLAIIDLGMPKLDGFGLIRYLRQTPKTVNLPIIVVTSRGDPEAIEKAFASGASGFVTKPINWSLFKYNVQFVLKSGFIEEKLRVNKTASQLTIRAKDKLIDLMSRQLEKAIATSQPILADKNLSDIIALSKLLTNKPPMEFERHDVNEIVANAVLHSQDAATRKAVIVAGRRSLVDIYVNVEHAMWLDALNRLVDLGIAASPAGGTVEILVGAQPDGSLVISIRDNGSAKSQSEIDELTNILIEDKQKNLNSGPVPDLSFEIIKRTTELHNGQVLFQNKVGQANVSALWLPANLVEMLPVEKQA